MILCRRCCPARKNIQPTWQDARNPNPKPCPGSLTHDHGVGWGGDRMGAAGGQQQGVAGAQPHPLHPLQLVPQPRAPLQNAQHSTRSRRRAHGHEGRVQHRVQGAEGNTGRSRARRVYRGASGAEIRAASVGGTRGRPLVPQVAMSGPAWAGCHAAAAALPAAPLPCPEPGAACPAPPASTAGAGPQTPPLLRTRRSSPYTVV
jgi:hypothetical protein